ncbi:type VII secretion-associated serine protease mycosin [Corynebacterium sp. H113]|uniref:type VII secretion-associated serine protease mycosin n=1 Tax=Corynebacterium sp. H113 TaxID=3133419 RepID=UPI0030B7D10A
MNKPMMTTTVRILLSATAICGWIDMTTATATAQPETTSLISPQLAEHCQVTALSSIEATQQTTAVESHTQFRQVWDIATGHGVNIAVIDTGVAQHPRLPRLFDGGDFTDGAGAHFDCDAHGTLVAGIIAGTPGSDTFAGIAPNSTITSFRQTNAEYGDLDSLAIAINSAIDHGVDMINVSLASCAPLGVEPTGAASISHAVRRAEESGVLVVAAAGNTSETCTDDAVSWPAVFDTVLAVTSVELESDHESARYALTGDWIDIAAPGGPVLSLSPSDDGLIDLHVTGDEGSRIVGTSFAAPVVTATAALVKEKNPEFTPAQLREAITATANPVVSSHGIGTGVVNPLAAVTWGNHRLAEYHQGSPPDVINGVAVTAPRPEPAADAHPTHRLATITAVLFVLVVGSGFWRFGSRHSE